MSIEITHPNGERSEVSGDFRNYQTIALPVVDRDLKVKLMLINEFGADFFSETTLSRLTAFVRARQAEAVGG